MSATQTILKYKGPIEFKTTENLLQRVKNDLKTHSATKVIRKSVYNIMVECIENILKHHVVDPSTNIQPYIVLEKAQDKYLITTGNLISNDEIETLRRKLNDTKNQNKATLLKMYEYQINKENIFLEKGAGLGILTIALKSNNNFDFCFIPVNEHSSLFELQVTFPF